MKMQWELSAGDADVFALKLAFASDPDEGQGIDAETAASWGSFQIWVRGRNLCAHREEGESIDSVHWYLLPLVEWFARNWDPLLHEERLPAKNKGNTAWESLQATRFPPSAIEDNERKASDWETNWQDWWYRHSLKAAREGGLFPDIVIRRSRDQIELSWGSARATGMPDHYQFTESEGFATLSPQSVAEPLHKVLYQAAQYLSSQIPNSQRIGALKRTLRGLNSIDDARRKRQLAWNAGLGTTGRRVQMGWHRATKYLSSLAAGPRQAMLEVEATPLVVTGLCPATLMFGSLEPNIKDSDIENLTQAMADLFDPQGEPEEVHEVCRAAPIEGSGSRPWDQGYELAEEVHEYFDGKFERGEFVDVNKLIAELGIKVGQLDLSDENVRGCAIAGPQYKLGIFFNGNNDFNGDHNGDPGRRFTLAHELCHVLFDRDRGRPLAIASGPWAPRAIEQRANAFAAMLLMPVSVVKRVVAGLEDSVATVDSIDRVARCLRTGRLAVLRHLINLGFVDDSDRLRLETELVPYAWRVPEIGK